MNEPDKLARENKALAAWLAGYLSQFYKRANVTMTPDDLEAIDQASRVLAYFAGVKVEEPPRDG